MKQTVNIPTKKDINKIFTMTNLNEERERPLQLGTTTNFDLYKYSQEMKTHLAFDVSDYSFYNPEEDNPKDLLGINLDVWDSRNKYH